MLYVFAPAVIAGRDADKGLTVLWVCVGVGVLAVLVSLVLSIWALVIARRGEGGRKVLAIVAMLFAALSPFTGAAGVFFSILLMSGGASGRPVRDRLGRARRARPMRSSDWSTDLRAKVDHLDCEERRRLGALWLEDARLEHASVAAFGRLALDLLAIGAPPELVARAHTAALEEVVHARLAFSLASSYLGEPVSAGAFPEAALPMAAMSLEARVERVAFECLLDGDMGEGIAALAAASAARQGGIDPVVVAVLRTIARDEASHAVLARDVKAWLLASPMFSSAAERGARRAIVALRVLSTAQHPFPVERALPGRVAPAELDALRRREASRVLGSLEDLAP